MHFNRPIIATTLISLCLGLAGYSVIPPVIIGHLKQPVAGRYIFAEVDGVIPGESEVDPEELWPGDKDLSWRLAFVSFSK